MENAVVFLVDDSWNVLSALPQELEAAGHSVPLTARTLADAMEIVDKDLLKRFGVTVVVLDGNLRPGFYSCEDGQAIAVAIRRKESTIKIIAYSSSFLADYGDLRSDGSVSVLELIAKL